MVREERDIYSLVLTAHEVRAVDLSSRDPCVELGGWAGRSGRCHLRCLFNRDRGAFSQELSVTRAKGPDRRRETSSCWLWGDSLGRR